MSHFKRVLADAPERLLVVGTLEEPPDPDADHVDAVEVGVIPAETLTESLGGAVQAVRTDRHLRAVGPFLVTVVAAGHVVRACEEDLLDAAGPCRLEDVVRSIDVRPHQRFPGGSGLPLPRQVDDGEYTVGMRGDGGEVGDVDLVDFRPEAFEIPAVLFRTRPDEELEPVVLGQERGERAPDLAAGSRDEHYWSVVWHHSRFLQVRELGIDRTEAR
jgi:hypothetical protein